MASLKDCGTSRGSLIVRIPHHIRTTEIQFGIIPNENKDVLMFRVLVTTSHTPDSSRYWILDSYLDLHARGEEPESLDKEFLRLWLVEKGISDDNIPKLDDDIRTRVSERYIDLFERVTGETFVADRDDTPILERIEKNIAPYF